MDGRPDDVDGSVAVRLRPAGVEGAVGRLDPGSGWITVPNTPFTQSMTASVERKFADSTSRSAPTWPAAAR